jgi:hypothetical protein
MSLQPIQSNTPIADASGRPTQSFLFFVNQLLNFLSTSTSTLAQQAFDLATALLHRNINTTGGLQGGGDLETDLTLSLTDTGVTPGSYTNTNLTVDSKGRITTAANGSGGGGGGGMVLLSDITITAGQATVDLTALNSSSYVNYVIEGFDITNNASSLLLIQYSTDGGVSYDASANYWYAVTLFGSGGFSGGSNTESGTAINIGGSMDSAAVNGSSFRAELFNPGGSVSVKQLIYDMALSASDGHNYNFRGVGRYNITTPVNAIRVSPSAGTFSTGRIRLYGIA